MSPAPGLPGFSPLITSGDMYMGVPVMDRLDVSVGNAALMQVDKTLEQLKRVNHDNLLIFDSTMLQEIRQRSSRTELHKNVCQRSINLVVALQNSSNSLPLCNLLTSIFVHSFKLLHALLRNEARCFLIIHHTVLVELSELSNQCFDSFLLRLSRQVRSGPHDIEVRNEKRHTSSDLGTKLGILFLTQRKNVASPRHSHSQLERKHSPAKCLSVGSNTVITNEADPVKGKLRQLEVVHLSSIAVHVEQRTLTKFRSKHETCLDELLAVLASSLFPDDTYTVHEGIGELRLRAASAKADVASLQVDTQVAEWHFDHLAKPVDRILRSKNKKVLLSKLIGKLVLGRDGHHDWDVFESLT
ncbi:hypothetical protein HG530_004718 [Fusarium avenaceum]|nr:hypothetical protein HG530_004718 [Fusarium avenaceum]